MTHDSDTAEALSLAYQALYQEGSRAATSSSLAWHYGERERCKACEESLKQSRLKESRGKR